MLLTAIAPLVLPSAILISQEAPPARVGAEARVPGPVIGDLRPDGGAVWFFLEGPRAVDWRVLNGEEVAQSGARALESDEPAGVTFRFEDLTPGTEYRVEVARDGELLATAAFSTPPPHGQVASVRLAFGSCASHDRFESQPIWTAMANTSPDALVLLGDTPYIDSTETARQRARYQEFWSIPELRPFAASVPVYATWDDHDFSTNDQVGAQPGRERSRAAFVEFHPQPGYGDGTNGIYTSFRAGPAEVFLVDTRWFGDEEALGQDEDTRSLLGKVQREWLVDSVSASKAEIKILACGMVWNHAVRPGKRDHWGTWSVERDWIFAELGRRSTTGVVLVGGDVHWPRAIRHIAAEEFLGYAPIELVSSPLANHPIKAASEPHPGLIWDEEAESVALVLEVGTAAKGGVPAVLARFIGPDGGTLHAHTLSAADLGMGEDR